MIYPSPLTYLHPSIFPSFLLSIHPSIHPSFHPLFIHPSYLTSFYSFDYDATLIISIPFIKTTCYSEHTSHHDMVEILPMRHQIFTHSLTMNIQNHVSFIQTSVNPDNFSVVSSGFMGYAHWREILLCKIYLTCVHDKQQWILSSHWCVLSPCTAVSIKPLASLKHCNIN